MTDDDTPRIVHDTLTIISVNAAACLLFRADERDLVDQKLSEGTKDYGLKELIKVRMSVIREHGTLNTWEKVPFMRLDGTMFRANVKTIRLENGQYETTMVYVDEY